MWSTDATESYEERGAHKAQQRGEQCVESHTENFGGVVDSQELHKEPFKGVQRDVEGERLAAFQPPGALQRDDDSKDCKTPQRFVKKCWMKRFELDIARRAMFGQDFQPPRKRCGSAKELLIEIVTPASDALSNNHRRSERIAKQDRVELAMAR